MKLGDLMKEFEFDLTKNQGEPNYMVIQNLKQIARNVDQILSMDEKELLDLMAHHPWAVDHLSTSKDDIEEVFNFLQENLSSIDSKHGNTQNNEDL